jgi:hypothetical protein
VGKSKEPSKRRGKVVKNGDGAATVVQGEAVAPKSFDAAIVAQELGAWWLSGKDAFLMRDDEGRWHVWGQQSIIDAMRDLPGRLIAIKARESETLSEAKRVLLWIRRNRAVDAVMTALPGYKGGVYDLPGGERVLVKTSPVKILPVPGEWPTIRRIIEGMLGPDATMPGSIDQTPWFWSLCKCWYRAFMTGDPDGWKQRHAVIFTGPAGCGKNLVQELILTALVGGRYADPLKFLMDEDQFNGDMMVEHWLLSEIPSSQRTEDRVQFAERIKQIVANRTMRARLMRSEPSTIQPFVCLSVSVNDDEDTLRSLPVVSSGYGDKINIFHCRRSKLPILGESDLTSSAEREQSEETEDWDDESDDTFEREKEIRRVINEEMPAFVDWLCNEWKIPGELLKPMEDNENPKRFGFRSFHHPVIKAELFDDTPAAQLLRLIDMAEFTFSAIAGPQKLWELTDYNADNNGRTWHERGETLQNLLTGETDWTCSVVTMAKKLFAHNSCTRLLGRLASDPITGGVMGRVMKADTRSWKGWRIGPPVA